MNEPSVYSEVLHNDVKEPGRPLITELSRGASEKGVVLVLFARVSMETGARSKQSLYCFICLCAPCTLPELQIPWYWSYRLLKDATCVLKTVPGSSGRSVT